MGKLWVAVVLLACILSAHSTEDNDNCPDSCKCGSPLTPVIMRCTKLPQDNQLRKDVAHFELAHSDKPMSINEKAFAQIGLTDINGVTLNNISITHLDNGAFHDLPELSDVKITHTNVSHIHPDIFQYNNKLKRVNLTSNPLTGIDSFINSNSVEELDISYCNISKIPLSTFRNLKQLTLVDLSGNNIKELIPGIFDSLEDITEIRLSNNLIKKIPKNIFKNNTELQNLYLDNNPLITFPGDIVNALTVLSVRNCKLEFLNSSIFGNPESLQDIDLSGNKINYIDIGTFKNIKTLKTINLSGNDLQHIDENIFSENKALEKIVLDDNKKIKELPQFKSNDNFNVYWFSCQNCGLESLSEKTFKNMPGMVTLILSHNKIYDITTDVFHQLNELIDLDISYNQISTFDDNTFKKNINLDKLNLAGNPLKALHPSVFTQNKNLKNLDLSNCGLFNLWTSSAETLTLTSIQNLNVSNNKIGLITDEDVKITSNLKSLDISENPLQCTDGYKTLIEYLTTNDIQDSMYKTHENMDNTAEELPNHMVHWKDQAKALCPHIHFEETYTEIDHIVPKSNSNIDTHEGDDEQERDDEHVRDDDPDYDSESAEDDEDTENEYASESKDAIGLLEDQPPVVLPSRHGSYSYLKPLFVFISTAIAILALTVAIVVLVTNLFVKRRRQIIQVPRILHIGAISKLKKNSGLVYQPLSEERDGVKTPILSRFIAMPNVHQPASAPENV